MTDPSTAPRTTDVIVVGGGNAGFSAAFAAVKRGRSTVILEKGPAELGGGNSYFTAGATRINHAGLDDVIDFIEPDERHERTHIPAYPSEEFAADLFRLTNGRNDPELTRVLVTEAQAAMRWLAGLGLRYRLMYERQAYERADGTFMFWGGLHIGNVGGGKGMITDHTRVARELGIDIHYSSAATDLVVEDGRVVGVKAQTPAGTQTWQADSVILAAGGFESSQTRRRKHLGDSWASAKLRGTTNNTGEMIDAALAIGAAKGGDWSSAHGVQWDAFCNDNESNPELTNRLTRQSYPLGIMVNRKGRRFVDEGSDFRNYTYAKLGKIVLEQPESLAYQIYDDRLRPMLRTEEYDMPGVSVATADTIEMLAAHIDVDPLRLRTTIDDFNASIDPDIPFDPTIRDGRRAGVDPPKSNWASPIDQPPFYAFPVTGAITFTFGGLKGDSRGRVLDDNDDPIPGLFVCGEMLGGLFSENYPGGSGLAAGMVFGRAAGSSA